MVFVLHSGAVVFVKFTKRWRAASWAMRDQHRGVPQLLRLGTTDQADICRNPQPSESYCITACLSEAVADLFPVRSGGGRSGQSAEEQAAVGHPYEPFGDDGVALIVDLEPAIVHEP